MVNWTKRYHLAAIALVTSSVLAATDAIGGEVPDTQRLREALAALVGEWRGSLTYIDYGNGNEYEIPLATRHVPNADRTALVSWNAYTDPGHIVHTVDVLAVDESGEVVTIAGFRDGEATVLAFRVLAFERLADGWRLVLAREGLDDGRQAAMTRSLELEGDRFVSRKRVRFADEEASFERNRVQLERVEG
ncbi:MAG: hypothetical protein AAGA68_26610 [Pseudomonadota bacterium]